MYEIGAEKLICGKRHIWMPCFRCNTPAWFSEKCANKKGGLAPYCEDCMGYGEAFRVRRSIAGEACRVVRKTNTFG